MRPGRGLPIPGGPRSGGASSPIRAIRGWAIRSETAGQVRLESLIVRFPWDGPVARTGKPTLEAPSLVRCTGPRPEVGFFACKPEVAYGRLQRYSTLSCLGTVSLFGRVVEHEHGYRAEKVRVDALWLVREALPRRLRLHIAPVAEELEERYRCRLVLQRSFRAAVWAACATLGERAA